ncbi:ATP-binding protein [Polynucleobacter sp. 78F-HAINBA]|jgi:hypothetical protein|uniref:ATP-binding protein n=1 Tax=Polynucleobacter sp. 78F-HAINBA TaxID=2689099 RepID=UPI001C0C369E|nr:ATP-binding protein [Polynucleobacter sp. 78F-HAINBA]MBU3590423.1 ATP-binding protein [Polynucleobacter sp. 78F-HAINBA]
MTKKEAFTFDISLSVLNHLGRSLYRSFATVLGEAISNAWDADAKNVWIFIDREKGQFFIKDDGIGMSAEDFQEKFLRIGYSKRKDNHQKSAAGRPFIGRKGIGKLALLSCAKKISVISKMKGGNYVGGVINNQGLDKAITEDLTPNQYPLETFRLTTFKNYTKNHAHGTIIFFDEIHEGIRSTFDFLGKVIALYFRFSLLDKSFNIYLNGEKITHKHLNDLAKKTQFLWKIGNRKDPYVTGLEKDFFAKEKGQHESKEISISDTSGFIASVEKPRDLNILGTGDRVGIDLFVNGRLRERDLLKHIPTARLAESYLYGQIHFDKLDTPKVDRFTSSREGIVADDEEYIKFLAKLRTQLLAIVGDWDAWRIKLRQDGDPENDKVMTPIDRKSRSLYNEALKGFELPKGSHGKTKVDKWVDEFGADAQYNFSSYAECFIAENLTRKYIKEKKVILSKEAKEKVSEYKRKEQEAKNSANISIELRRSKDDLNYLDMGALANLADKANDRIKDAALSRDATEFKPMRDAVAHTALLTDAAKTRLSTVKENIRGRIKTLLKNGL